MSQAPLRVWGLIVFAVLACTVQQAPDNRHQTVNSASRTDRARDLANTWLRALSTKSFDVLRDLSTFPFEIRDTGSTRYGCPNKAVSEHRDNLEALVHCLSEDDLFFPTFKKQVFVHGSGMVRSQLPLWAKQWGARLEKNVIPVFFELYTDGITYYFVLLANDSGIQAFWKHGEFQPDP